MINPATNIKAQAKPRKVSFWALLLHMSQAMNTTAIAGNGYTYIYMAIRRPNKPPTLGTQVYNAIARTGTGAAATVNGVGFAPDLVIPQARSNVQGRIFSTSCVARRKFYIRVLRMRN